MSHNPITQLTQQLFDFFTIAGDDIIEWPCKRFQRCGDLVRYNSDNLGIQGDISIAADGKNWFKYCNNRGLILRSESDALLLDESAIAELVKQAENWLFPLAKQPELRKDRYTLRLQRRPLIAYVINAVLKTGEHERYGEQCKHDKSPTLCLELVNGGNENELRHYRTRQLHDIIRRLLVYSKWRVVAPKDKNVNTLCVHVQSACQTNLMPQSRRPLDVRVLSGVVLEPHKKSATTMTTSNYLALRSNDMLLMAMHRHGLRDCTKDRNYDELLQRLGAAAVIVDLFEVRHSSPATVVRSGLGCSKGAPYMLYNSARLETLLRTFNEKVEAGVYDPLPPFDQIDFSALEEELDWQLIYGYLLTFPELIEASLDQLKQGQCAVHLIVRYIFSLTSLFSRYYRHKQILVQQRPHLMYILYARIYLIKAVRQVLNDALALLGILPVDYM
ncbi:uncharacterized protein LOC115626778 [Scaptodrosophila lebanonensis]|uniref:Uncharacterized protein LOC115626778 n=1 Tax=Drosophila lebanonensis TaxID=7225 RepID=A0A6J2TPY4_DROLE|nr:uncharacterized protein LOC115626778 [Scaptodrosophila lebanonensis]